GGANGGSGTYNLSGNGRLSVGDAVIGDFGKGAFTQTGGTATFGGLSLAGSLPSASGTYSLSAGATLNVASEIIGVTGAGVFNQTGGSHTVGDLFMTQFPNSSGTFNLSGGTFLSTNQESIGENDGTVAVFNHTGGFNSASNFISLGFITPNS